MMCPYINYLHMNKLKNIINMDEERILRIYMNGFNNELLNKHPEC